MYERFDDLLHRLLFWNDGLPIIVIILVGALVVGGLFAYANRPQNKE